jgi:hypothetical protein
VGKRFGFHLQINLRIDVGGIEGDVTKPSANRVDVDTSPKKVNRSRVADDVGADSFRSKRGNSG